MKQGGNICSNSAHRESPQGPAAASGRGNTNRGNGVLQPVDKREHLVIDKKNKENNTIILKPSKISKKRVQNELRYKARFTSNRATVDYLHCNTLQYHGNALQHTVRHCKILPNTKIRCILQLQNKNCKLSAHLREICHHLCETHGEFDSWKKSRFHPSPNNLTIQQPVQFSIQYQILFRQYLMLYSFPRKSWFIDIYIYIYIYLYIYMYI